ncbi:non-structural maintenance of chromosomes element 1 homolog isoform X2 [Lycorma delicatula]
MINQRMFEIGKLNILHKKIFQDSNVSLDETIQLINSKINPLHLKIDKKICEISNKTMYVLYTTVKPKYNGLDLTSTEKEFVSTIFQQIVTDVNGSITTSVAINCCNVIKNKGLKLKDGEELIEDLINKQLFMYVNEKQTRISFTPLAVVELESDLRDSFSDYISDCPLCKHIVYIGNVCDNCHIKIHFHCLKNFGKVNRNKCPDCNSCISI